MIPFVTGSCYEETILFQKLIPATKSHEVKVIKFEIVQGSVRSEDLTAQ